LNLRRRPTATDWQLLRDQGSDFSCPTCGGSLVPVSTVDRYAFAFGCTAGHVVGLDELFERQTAALRSCCEAMIAVWERSIEQMAEGAAIAERNGSRDLARRLRRRIADLAARVLLLRGSFLQADPPA
jgi:hypothetical protein